MMALQVRQRKPKAWSWSYSKLKNYRTCPRRHYHCDIAKDVPQETSDALTWGNAVHEAMAARVGKNVPLPEDMQQFEDWAAKVKTDMPGAVTSCEHELAMTAEFKASAWFGNDTWTRVKLDVLQIIPAGSTQVASLIDWKTGRIESDSEQLGIAAAVVFANFPNVQKIRTRFVFLKEDADGEEDFTRQDMPLLWAKLLPELGKMKHAAETNDYPAKPSHLCKKYCPVASCEHHGK
ncbi:PD-(D/E)XK nuclease family protein [Methylocystis heyeri]|uniref:PD-(D/E)XK endonuclease-like domain-containing protein n=1 Tax=Methylocystis heyeri TaxID=391905 RepID=A0A6B8KI05_9HYPH|nr:PD-(D/E)XK nuclease family protein [Methylocystis heyeri]QGM46143.1 hypothetical protein H2LOC_010795 [Methylocystis heyeri]